MGGYHSFLYAGYPLSHVFFIFENIDTRYITEVTRALCSFDLLLRVQDLLRRIDDPLDLGMALLDNILHPLCCLLQVIRQDGLFQGHLPQILVVRLPCILDTSVGVGRCFRRAVNGGAARFSGRRGHWDLDGERVGRFGGERGQRVGR